MYKREGNRVYRKVMNGDTIETQVREFDSEADAAAFMNNHVIEPNKIFVKW